MWTTYLIPRDEVPKLTMWFVTRKSNCFLIETPTNAIQGKDRKTKVVYFSNVT